MSRLQTPRVHTRLSGLAAVALGATTIVAATTAPAAAGEALAEQSLVEVLDADGNRFDKNWDDFDIVHRAATTVLSEKPESAVAVLADGSTPLTAFLPDDRAFRRLVFELTGERPATEKATFGAVGGLGVDTIETVLLYHVAPGSTITYAQAKHADGAELVTAAHETVEVVVRDNRVRLRDLDADDRNPHVLQERRNINKGNQQIAHGINRVLRPVDLP